MIHRNVIVVDQMMKNDLIDFVFFVDKQIN